MPVFNYPMNIMITIHIFTLPLFVNIICAILSEKLFNTEKRRVVYCPFYRACRLLQNESVKFGVANQQFVL